MRRTDVLSRVHRAKQLHLVVRLGKFHLQTCIWVWVGVKEARAVGLGLCHDHGVAEAFDQCLGALECLMVVSDKDVM